MMEDDQRSSQAILQNVRTYLGFLIVALIGIYYGRSIQGTYPDLRLWTLENVLILCLAFPFLALFGRVGVPDFFDKSISLAQRWYNPLAVGMFFGILDVLVHKVLLHPAPYESMPPFLQPFPYSVFLYFSGALEIEVFYRLIPLTLILWMGTHYKSGAYFQRFYWCGLVLSSLREPLEQWPTGDFLFVVYVLGTGVWMNAIQAYFFMKYGFLASLMIRLGHYLYWHILLGVYVQYVELM